MSKSGLVMVKRPPLRLFFSVWSIFPTESVLDAAERIAKSNKDFAHAGDLDICLVAHRRDRVPKWRQKEKWEVVFAVGSGCFSGEYVYGMDVVLRDVKPYRAADLQSSGRCGILVFEGAVFVDR